MSKTKNLGQVSGMFIGTSAPQNTSIIWYDDTPNQKCHKVYDLATNTWKALSPDIVSNTTYSELTSNAQKNGLSIGKHYIIKDKSNVLAIAITTTKVQYSDTLGNIIIDDLGVNTQYHVSSSNLLIDDLSGVFNTETNKLIFTFKEQTNINTETDYLFGKVRSGSKWVLSKFRFSSLLSREINNSISWRNGFFFSFKNAINGILNKVGGVVGYDSYSQKVKQIDENIRNISKNNQEIIANANQLITEKTADTAIFNKKIQGNIDVTTAPGDILKGDTLFTIVSKFQRWVNKFKFANGINISKNFTDAKTQQFINNNDTVETAFGKIQYMLKNPTTSSMLPEDWTIGAKSIEGGFNDLNQNPNYTAFNQDGFPVAGDSIFYAFAKIVDFMQGGGKYSKLSSEWKEMSYTGDIEFPKANDTIDNAFSKIVAKIKQLGDVSYGKINQMKNDQGTIFDLINGRLTLSDNDEGDIHNSSLTGNELVFSRGQIQSFFAQDFIKMEDGAGYFFDVSIYGGLKYSTAQPTNNVLNGINSSVLFSNYSNATSPHCALQAHDNGVHKNTFDAFFRRIKLNTLTFNTKLLYSGTHYISREEGGLIIWGSSDNTGDLYLPAEPESGLMILIQQGGNASVNVYAQGKDQINTIGESSKSITISDRGDIFAFFYVAGINYDSETTTGMWECCRWSNKY